MSGTPPADDIGNNSWTVSVGDGIAPAVEAALNIAVYFNRWTELTFDDFELGWGNWTNGGGDAMLGTNDAIDTQCANLQDNTGDNASIWLKNALDLAGHSALGGNPTNQLGIGSVPERVNLGGVLMYIHPQRSDDPDLDYMVETSTNLLSGVWTNTGYATSGTNVTGLTFRAF